jgi:hypothetical protein
MYEDGYELSSVVPILDEINTPHSTLFVDGIPPSMWSNGIKPVKPSITEKQLISLRDTRNKLESGLKSDQMKLVVQAYYKICEEYDRKEMTALNKTLTDAVSKKSAFDELIMKVNGDFPWEQILREKDAALVETETGRSSTDSQTPITPTVGDLNLRYELTEEESLLEDNAIEDTLLAHVNNEDINVDDAGVLGTEFDLVDDAHHEDEIEKVVEERVQMYCHSHRTRSRGLM